MYNKIPFKVVKFVCFVIFLNEKLYSEIHIRISKNFRTIDNIEKSNFGFG